MHYASLVLSLISRSLLWFLTLWNEVSPYLAQLLLGTAAFLGLLKDWKDYGKLSARFGRYVPLGFAVLILAITYLGVQNTYQDSAAVDKDKQQAEIDKKSNQKVINQLSDQVAQLRQDNQNAAATFSKSFATLYDKFSSLQSKVQNTELLNEIKETKQQLEDTQKKLTQPKPNLIATFPTYQASEVPVKETTLPRDAGVVTVQFSIYNSSDVAATNGAIIVRVCELCKFAGEPPGFAKVAGAEESDREHQFQHIYAKAMMETFSVKVEVPPNVSRAAIGIFASCETCLAATEQELWFNVK